MPAPESGIVVPQDARSLAIADVNDDHAPDLVFGINSGPVRAFLRQSGSPSFLNLRLTDAKGHRDTAGAKVTLRSGTLPPQTAEFSSGGSYLTSGPRELWFTIQEKGEATVRWPDGTESRHPVSGPAAVIGR